MKTINISTINKQEVIVLPVLNVFREDLHLRREIVFWFEKVLQFELEWLICRDEIDFDAINSSSGLFNLFFALLLLISSSPFFPYSSFFSQCPLFSSVVFYFFFIIP